MSEPRYDVLAMGRSSIDLYSNDVGAPFAEIKSFAAYVGGCPTNVSVGTRRLGLRSTLLTAVGEDPVGDFVLRFLETEGVETRFIPRKPGHRTSAVLLGIQPPDRFPLVFYRDNCADNELTIDDVMAAPIDASRALFISGTGLCKEPSRSATVLAAERGRAAGATVYLDIDFRPDLWHDRLAFGVVLRRVLPLVDIAIGTEEEVGAVGAGGTFAAGEEAVLSSGPQALVVKRGAHGSSVRLGTRETIEAAAFSVEVYNVLGAGDAFATGFMYGRLKGLDWHKSARIGNACGAIVVTRHGCANFMPYEAEVLAFLEERGGF